MRYRCWRVVSRQCGNASRVQFQIVCRIYPSEGQAGEWRFTESCI